MSPDFTARNVLEYTAEVQQIKERANSDSQNFTLSDCCHYEFQILDQYCASRFSVSSCTVSDKIKCVSAIRITVCI